MTKDEIPPLIKETQDQLKAHAMAHEYYLQFKKQFENRKIIAYKYTGCPRDDLHNFEDDLIELFKDGWQPYGSPMIEVVNRGTENEDIFFWQAVVKYE